MTNLKPCPFCGGPEVTLYYGPTGWPKFLCQDCRATGPQMNTREEAEDRWNARATDPAVKRLMEAAQAWWISKRPVDYDEQQHIGNPAINCCSESERRLAEVVAEVKNEDER
jgi:Lar family restriction alleviation protein